MCKLPCGCLVVLTRLVSIKSGTLEWYLLSSHRMLSPSAPPLSPHRATSASGTPVLAQLSRGEMSRKSNESEEQDVGRRKTIIENTLQTVKVIADLAKEVSSNAGIPGLTDGLSVLSLMLEKVQTMSTTVKGIDELSQRIQELSKMLYKFRADFDGEKLSRPMQDRIGDLAGKWIKIGQRLSKLKKPSKIMQWIKSDVNAEELSSLVAEIGTSLQDFVAGGALYVEENVHHIRQGMEGMRVSLEVMEGKVDEVASNQGTSALPRARNAQYDSSAARRSCLPGTRVPVLDRVRDWVGPMHAQEEPRTSRILWINGSAGMGKSTIAFSIVEEYRGQGILAANFFFARDDTECRDPKIFFPTLASQLCSFHDPLKQEIAAVLRKDPGILDAGPARQLEELIVKPLEKVKARFPTSVIVIDALDECRDTSGEVSIWIILTALDRFIGRLGPLLLILTSRLEPRIEALLGSKSRGSALSSVTTPLNLHTVGQEALSGDLSQYFTHELKQAPTEFHVPEDWPQNEDIHALTIRSHGLFIYASTAVRYILGGGDSKKRSRQPVQQLKRLLKMGSSRPAASLLLDRLYEQVLEEAGLNAAEGDGADEGDERAEDTEEEEGEDNEEEVDLRSIIGIVVTAEEPLSIAAIAGLLGFTKRQDEVRNSLSRLHSVLHIPDNYDDPVRIIHPTFRDFLSKRTGAGSNPKTFHIELAAQHSSFFLLCLDAMQALRKDIAGLTDPLLSKKEIPGLAAKVKERIPPHLSYACRRWSTHLQHIGPQTTDLFSALEDFLERRLLHWLESCSLLEVLEGALYALDVARRKCESLGEPFQGLTNTFSDYRRFAVKYAACIYDAPLQLYDSVLAVTPSESVVARRYRSGPGCKSSLVVHSGAISGWGPGIDSFASHSSSERVGIYSVAFSPDGVFFATTGADRRIRIWRALTRTMVLVIEGLKDKVNSVAYSPDGANIVSGSNDSLVQTWDAVSGTHIRDFEGHSGNVVFVSYVADGTKIFSASSRGEIKLWSASDGRVLFQHAAPNMEWGLSEVGVSPDGAMTTYYEEGTLYLHDLSTQQRDALDLPDKCWATTFSPDGKRVAAATNAGIWVWSLPGKSLVCQLDDLECPYCLAFSSDAAQIACGCKDGSVHLWRLGLEGIPRVSYEYDPGNYDLKHINSIAWSPDGAMLTSVAVTGIVSVWDTAAPSIASSDPRQQLPSDQHPTGPACFGLFEYNGGQAIHDLPPSLEHNLPNDPGMPVIEGGPTAKLYSSRAACYCDNLVELSPEFPPEPSDIEYPFFSWAYLLGRMHEHQTGRRSPIVFSPDGTLLAYVHSDNDIRVCNLRTRTVVATLTGHTHAVRSAVFSPSGALLASGDEDGTVNVWDASTGSLLSGYKQERGARDVAFSFDGRLVASCAGRPGIYVADVVTGDIVRHFPPVSPEDYMVRVTFDRGGEHVLALDSRRPSVYVWNISSGTCICQFSLRDNSWFPSLDFSPNDTGIILNSPGNAPCALTLWNPGDRRWPAYHVDKTGWIYAQGPGYTRRLGWLPQDWGFTLCSEGTCVHVWDRSRKVVVEIDLSQALQDAGLSVTQ